MVTAVTVDSCPVVTLRPAFNLVHGGDGGQRWVLYGGAAAVVTPATRSTGFEGSAGQEWHRHSDRRQQAENGGDPVGFLQVSSIIQEAGGDGSDGGAGGSGRPTAGSGGDRQQRRAGGVGRSRQRRRQQRRWWPKQGKRPGGSATADPGEVAVPVGPAGRRSARHWRNCRRDSGNAAPADRYRWQRRRWCPTPHPGQGGKNLD